MSLDIARGVSRIVFCVGSVAVKLPSLHNGQRYFVYGMLGNVLERDHWKIARHPALAPVYHCGPFGLWLVMKRYRDILPRALTKTEKDALPFINIDNNGNNAAIEHGRIVLIDYGNPGMYYDAEKTNELHGIDTQRNDGS